MRWNLSFRIISFDASCASVSILYTLIFSQPFSSIKTRVDKQKLLSTPVSAVEPLAHNQAPGDPKFPLGLERSEFTDNHGNRRVCKKYRDIIGFNLHHRFKRPIVVVKHQLHVPVERMCGRRKCKYVLHVIFFYWFSV